MTLTAASRRPARAGKRRKTAILLEARQDSDSGTGPLSNDAAVAAPTRVAALRGRRRWAAAEARDDDERSSCIFPYSAKLSKFAIVPSAPLAVA